MPKISNKKLPSIPHLYQKGRALYYRLVIPRDANGFPSGKEIRICLQTCKMKEARKVITVLHAHALQRISESTMAEDHNASGGRKADARQKLRAELEAKLAEIVNGSNKTQLSQVEIKQRLLGRLIQKLDEEEAAPSERYAITETGCDGKEHIVSESEVWQRIAKSITVQADKYEFDEDTIRTNIMELVLDGTFKESEISPVNSRW